MRKTHGYRKPAMALVFVFLTGLVLAACSSSSSVDDALSHPGDRFLGTVTFKGGPGGLDVVEVSPAAQITQAEGFQVWTDGGSWNGVDTTTGDVVFKWLDTSSRLENVDIEIYDADAEGQDAYLNGDDVCGGATIAGCGTNPGYFYVSENAADGPETEIEYEGLTGLPRASRYLRAIPPKTTVKVPWSVVEPSGNQYQFYAMVMADKIPATTANDDPRYDPDTGTFTIQAYRLNPTTTKNPGVATDQPITSVKPGQWFYGVVWVDLPGADRPGTGICADGGDGDSTCYTDVNATNYDYYFVEDQDNFNAPTYASLQSYPSYCSYYNTGFAFMGGSAFELQFDPAVLTTNDDIMDSNNQFTTANGTKMRSYDDADTTDQMGVLAASSSTTYNRFVFGNIANYDCSPSSSPVETPPMPDTLDTYGDPTIPGNWVQGDYPAAKLAFQAIGNPGEGSRLSLANNGNTNIKAAFGLKSTTGGGCASYKCAVAETSTNYPMWTDSLGTNTGQGFRVGAYNERMGYVEIQ